MNLKIFYLIFILPIKLYSQEEIYLYPEKSSEFVYGEDSILIYIKQNFCICNHFNEIRSATVQFVVEPNGGYSNLIFISKINDDLKEKIRVVINQLPLWKPGTVKDKPVRSYRILNIICKKEIKKE
jgi:hypothetical protein